MWHRDTSIQRVLHGVGDGIGIIHARLPHLRHNAGRSRKPGAPGVGCQIGGTHTPKRPRRRLLSRWRSEPAPLEAARSPTPHSRDRRRKPFPSETAGG